MQDTYDNRTRPVLPTLMLAAALALTSVPLLSGCAAAVVGAGGAAMVAHDRRSSGQVLDDQTTQYEIGGNIDDSSAFSNDDHVKVEVYNGVVLLVGAVTSQSKKLEAGRIAAEPDDVRRVVNELEVGDEPGFWSKTDDGWDSTRVNTALMTENPIEGFDPTLIKVVSSQDTVYLMGLVSHEEADAVTEVVRNVGGVKKVVRVFDYTD